MNKTMSMTSVTSGCAGSSLLCKLLCSYGEQGYAVARRLLTAVASPVVEH